MSVPDTPLNMAKCICGSCPSMLGAPSFFCAKGKYKGKVAKKGCICMSCALWGEYKLKNGYFCISGKS